ncbi:Imm32 family immunity protein [Chitinophaga sp.]|uniref:Imm32 family immunity protein n=1 Tax=Chitinophaga sp. TaxID=1869181 RepID=UPI002F94C4A3
MELSISIPPFSADRGIEYKWESGFSISIRIEGDIVKLAANRQGLVSLANHLLNLAQDEVPSGYHLHFDEHNSLEDGSAELVIEKI